MPFFLVAADAYDNPLNVRTVTQLVSRLIEVAVWVMMPLAALAVIIAAFMYTMSAGNPENIKRANSALKWGLIGFFLVLGAQFVKDVVIGVAGQAASKNFADFISSLVYTGGTILVALSVLMIMYSAFLFITGGSDPQKRVTARNVLVYALIGVALAVLAFAIPRLIQNFLKKPPKPPKPPANYFPDHDPLQGPENPPPNFGGTESIDEGEQVNPFFNSGASQGPEGRTEEFEGGDFR